MATEYICDIFIIADAKSQLLACVNSQALPEYL